MKTLFALSLPHFVENHSYVVVIFFFVLMMCFPQIAWRIPGYMAWVAEKLGDGEGEKPDATRHFSSRKRESKNSTTLVTDDEGRVIYNEVAQDDYNSLSDGDNT